MAGVCPSLTMGLTTCGCCVKEVAKKHGFPNNTLEGTGSVVVNKSQRLKKDSLDRILVH